MDTNRPELELKFVNEICPGKNGGLYAYLLYISLNDDFSACNCGIHKI